MEIKGKIVQTLPLQKGVSKSSGKEWSKATVVIEFMSGKYTKQLALDNFKDAVEFANLPHGVEYNFHIEPESHEWNGKWFSSIGCWKWEKVEQAQQLSSPQPAPADIKGADDMPF